MSTKYYRDVRATLLKFSPNGATKTLEELVLEWERLPRRRGEKSDECQLCGHNSHTYSDRIRHKATDRVLLIGSKCIDNFWPLPGPAVLLPLLLPRLA